MDDEQTDSGLRDHGRRAGPAVEQAHLAEERARPERRSFARGDFHARAAVQDQEELVAGLVLARENGAGRRLAHLGDLRHRLELTARAAFEQRHFGQSRNLVVLFDTKAEEATALLAAAPGGLRNRAIEHSTDQFHASASLTCELIARERIELEPVEPARVGSKDFLLLTVAEIA